MEILTGVEKAAWLGTIYGVSGIGKSTLATYAPKPLFIDCEGGLKRIDCARLERAKNFDDVIAQLRFAFESDYHTIVVDTLSAVTKKIEEKILADNGADNLRDTKKFPFDLAKQLQLAHWSLFVRAIKSLAEDAGKNVLLVGHDHIETVTNPSGDNYQRHSIQMFKHAVEPLMAEMDFVFFAHHEKVFLSKAGTDQKVVQSTGNRLLMTVEKLFCVGKNRMRLPEKIPFNTQDDCKKLFENLEA